MSAPILLVEDSESLAAVYQAYLAKEEYQVAHVSSGEAALRHMLQSPPQVILLDLKLPDMSGMDILQWMASQQINSAVIIITAHGSVDTAIDSMRLGVFDYLEKPFDASRLLVTVKNALKFSSLQNLVDEYQSDTSRTHYHGFVGASLAMQRIYKMIDAVAPSKATVFITGESGTGKEVCAEAVHKQGPRASKPFVALNCGAIPKELMESEIFGHMKGAFTGAAAERKGAAELADGGTLFLDEIGEMDMELQTKLLRFIQTSKFQKVGGSKEIKVNIRFICATNRDPWEEVKAGRFREDLYYRLYVIPIHLPPLRDRGQDILAIATKLLRHYAQEEGKAFTRFSSTCASVLLHHDWPGNVRELQNIIRNICVLQDGEVVEAQQLPPPLSQVASENYLTLIDGEKVEIEEVELMPEFVITEEIPLQPLWLTERQAIEKAIAHCQGNIPKAAELLEVSPSTIYRKKQSWDELAG